MQLEIKGLCKNYGDVAALDAFSLTMGQGVYGLLGPNGAGKSTLIHILTDYVKRDSGEILFDGQEILKMGAGYREKVGYMPQQQVGYKGFSAQAFLEYVAALKGLPPKKQEVKTQIKELLCQVNLYEVRHRKIGVFSGGMLRRVLLAQALLGRPELLILDEPTAGLDPKERIVMRNMIANLALDKIVILATHIVSDIECIADKVILLKNGKLVCCETPGDLVDGVSGKVAEFHCSREELLPLQEKYNVGSVKQETDGFCLHLTGGELPDGVRFQNVAIDLEDVYLYYFGE